MDRQMLATKNQKLVYEVWNRYFNIGKNIKNEEEFIGEGLVALVKAANTYDPDSGVRFSTYAYRCIKNEMSRIIQVNNYEKRRGRDSREVYFYDPLPGDWDGIRYIDALEAETSDLERLEEVESAKKLVEEILSELSEKERELLTEYYGLNGREPKMMKQIAEEWGESNIDKKIAWIRTKIRRKHKFQKRWRELNEN
jgi:RNA polymerase sporulation-specific sigma factor